MLWAEYTAVLWYRQISCQRVPFSRCTKDIFLNRPCLSVKNIFQMSYSLCGALSAHIQPFLYYPSNGVLCSQNWASWLLSFSGKAEIVEPHKKHFWIYWKSVRIAVCLLYCGCLFLNRWQKIGLTWKLSSIHTAMHIYYFNTFAYNKGNERRI